MTVFDDRAFNERIALLNEFDALQLDAIEALTAVLEHPNRSTYQPQVKAMLDALNWLEMDVTCGDCIEGRCHWGGEMSRESIAAVKAGREFREECGCARHEASVETRSRRARLSGQATR